jgi:acyl-CoA thioester hydrolase
VEWLRDLGFSVGELQQSGYIFPVVSAELQYLSPAYLDDELEVHTQLVETKRVSLVFSQYVTRYNSNEILCKARIKVAYVDIHNMRPARLPEKLCQQ